MNINDEEIEVKELEKCIYHPVVIHQSSRETEILRIVNEDAYTRIDFIYYAPKYYHCGGWVRVFPEIFIRPIQTDLRLQLIKAENIPMAPSYHFFKRSGECLPFTLYFPSLPKDTVSIDIIEREGPGKNWFNFFGVSMEKIQREALMVEN